MKRLKFTGGAANYDASKRKSTVNARASTASAGSSGAMAKSRPATATTAGFFYGRDTQTPTGQAPRYPPWESDTTRYRAHPTRPMTVDQIPRNFQSYHSSKSNVAGSAFNSTTSRSGSTSTIRSSYADFSSRDESKPTRNWEHTGLGSLLQNKQSGSTALLGGGLRFTVMCYNVLAPSLLDRHSELYRKCCKDYLSWDFRRALFFEEVETYSPDIVCLQEIEADHYEETFVPTFNALGFRGVYKKKTGDKQDGCAIFYRTSKFFLVDKLEVEFFQPHVPLLNRDNVGLLVKLETRNVLRRQKIVVGTTHLLFNPKRQDVKLAQAQVLLAELDRFAFCGFDKGGSGLYLPVIMTGDFNCNPHSCVTKLFSEGRIQYIDENGDLIKHLRHKRINSLLPRLSGISDQCQHYKLLLNRYQRWKSKRTDNFEQEADIKFQESLVELYPFMEARGRFKNVNVNNACASSSVDGIISLLSPVPESEEVIPGNIQESSSSNSKFLVQAVVSRTMQADSLGASCDTSKSASSEQLYFPEHHQCEAHFDRNTLDQLSKYDISCDFASGSLSHNFNFRDIYSGKLDRQGKTNEAVVTTKQNGWTCVDYIYQSMTWHSTFNKMVEGKLKLIRRLGLYTRSECKKKDIPNEHHPSDHFPLVAEFLLRN